MGIEDDCDPVLKVGGSKMIEVWGPQAIGVWGSKMIVARSSELCGVWGTERGLWLVARYSLWPSWQSGGFVGFGEKVGESWGTSASKWNPKKRRGFWWWHIIFFSGARRENSLSCSRERGGRERPQ